MTKRRQFSAKCKFQIGLEALKSRQMLNEIASTKSIRHPRQAIVFPLLDEGAKIFSEKARQCKARHKSQQHSFQHIHPLLHQS